MPGSFLDARPAAAALCLVAALAGPPALAFGPEQLLARGIRFAEQGVRSGVYAANPVRLR